MPLATPRSPAVPWLAPSRPPLKAGQVRAARPVEPHSLPLEPKALRLGRSVGAETDGPANVQNAMPGDRAVIPQGVERVADLPRSPGDARELRDLAVRRDSAPWNTANQVPDSGVAGLARPRSLHGSTWIRPERSKRIVPSPCERRSMLVPEGTTAPRQAIPFRREMILGLGSRSPET